MQPPSLTPHVLDVLALSVQEVTPAVYRELLKEAQQQLWERFQAGDAVANLVSARAEAVDLILVDAWRRFDLDNEAELALLAVGGYGRGELHPASDIDVLVLHSYDNLSEILQDKVSQFIALLWDLGLDLGSSVRSLSDCVEKVSEDVTIATNLLEVRTLIGNDSLRQTLLALIQPLWTDAAFFEAKRDEQLARHAKHHHTEYNLEPDIKNAPGGLRDIQTVVWVAKRHFGTTNLYDLVTHGFLTEFEYKQLSEGETFLWRIRFALHMVAKRNENRLLFDYQRTLAHLFGFTDNNLNRAVEQFMKDYYRVAMTLSMLNEMLLQYFDEAILRADEHAIIEPLNEDFQIRDNYLEVTHHQVFARNPTALMEIFAILSESPHITGIRASTIRLIMVEARKINAEFRHNPQNRAYFMEILRSPRVLFSTLRKMKRYGVLGQYLPAFGAIVGQMQYDLFHIYTVDAHTLLVIKNMRRFRYSDSHDKFPVVTEVAQNLPKPELLYLAGLFHDIGKGRGGDHSELGAVDAIEFCLAHGLSNRSANIVAWLTRHHLLMSMTAQKQDLGDPDVIQAFAEKVGDLVHLDYLYALTVADICATNPKLWNSWRASLLRQLYQQTRRVLRRGLNNPIDRDEVIAETRITALELLLSENFDESAVNSIWAELGDDYFLRESATDIAWQTAAILNHGNSHSPLVAIQESHTTQFQGATQIFVYTKDLPNLFAASVATLDQQHLTVLDARIITATSKFSLDTYIVLDEQNTPISDQYRLESIRQSLVKALSHPEQFPTIAQKRLPRELKHFSVKTEVNISNDISKQQTSLEIITLDRPGLLARIGVIFMEHGVSIHSARIATLGERAEDVFFITDRAGQPVSNPDLCQELATALRQQLDTVN
ncbi:[protein-PII] uridylyltransferase [Agitococcus lubricus]|uniref:Bifunctional uridylyltransferase/uridylyl-removing enzyme n=1 Tax=Agitococcus lubricus TaxID=1077255 RepID=A0A2T5J058_9GAMM|nr:[protein-PII] uridylyltransferase [Agitococcus lubricus]PTQ89717.1 UTP--GlnB (protein PII) uridylyltransferase GlnD [Agitococcus lubricus]